jgi:hypothetical protein
MATIEKVSRKDEMFALIEQWKQSNQTQKLFCQEQSIALSCFYYWQKKYRKDQSGPAGFVPVLVNDTTSGIREAVEIHYPSGVTVRVPTGSSVTLLKTLIDLV